MRELADELRSGWARRTQAAVDAQGLERVIRRLLDKTPATRIGVEEAMDLLHRISAPGEPVPSGPGYQKPAHPRPRSSFAVIAAQGPAKAAELLRKMGPRTAGEVLDNMGRRY